MDIAEKGHLDSEAIKYLNNIADRFLKKAAECAEKAHKLKEGNAKAALDETSTAFEAVAINALSIAERDILSEQTSRAESVKKAVSDIRSHNESDLGFNFEGQRLRLRQLGFDGQQLDELYQHTMQEQFKSGMAALVAGRDFHPQIDYISSRTPMSRFGKLMKQCTNDAHKSVISAAHALIQSGVDPNQDSDLWTKPLWQNQSPEILDALLDAGADPNKPTTKYADPLLIHHFPEERPADMTLVKKLVEAGAKINVKTRNGNYPLLNASRHNTPELAL